MRKFLIRFIIGAILLLALYFVAVYYLTFSEGFRAGELVKISNKGVIFKTWEGRLSQGVSEELQFEFSIEDRETQVIEDLKNLQGQRVKLTYKERFGTFPWLGDTKYYVTKVERTKELE
ncbi:MAG: 6-phosphogluconate dehydrogenase [Flavobacteriaceae bacterium]